MKTKPEDYKGTIIKYEGHQHSEIMRKLDDDNTHLQEKRKTYSEAYYRTLWYSSCEEAATLRAEKHRYYAMYLDAKDKILALEQALYRVSKVANRNRFADLGIDLYEKELPSKGEEHDDSQNN